MIYFANQERDLIVLTTETRWDEAPRMRHYVANQLSKYYNVLYCELYMKGLPETRSINDNLIVRRVGYYISGVSKFKFSKEIYDTLQASFIISYAKKYNAPRVLLLNFRFDFSSIYKTSSFRKKYFFLNDDFVNMNPSDSVAARLAKQLNLEKTVSMCDRVFASSEPLAEDVKHLSKATSVIYSGHDFISQYQSKIRTKINEKFDVCVMGFINFNLEFDWLIKLSHTNKVNVNLIGPVENEGIRVRLSAFSNVKFYAPKTGVDLQNFLMKQDVLLMPYTSSLINTKASVPAKLFQYLACGKPVVSSLMPDLIELPDGFVYQSKDEDKFVENIFLAHMNNSIELTNERIKFAEKHTWDSRGDELRQIIDIDSQLV